MTQALLSQASTAAVLRQTGRVTGAAGPFERLTVVIVALAISATAFTLSLASPGMEGERWGKAFSAAAAGVALLYAYLQWRAARHETSYDRYYDRLEIANRRSDAARLKELEGDTKATQDHLHTMFVFAELDNLEYLLGKYRLRFVRADLACRALHGFTSRCEDRRFREAAVVWVQRDGIGYEPSTRTAVETLAQTAASRA